MQRKTFMAKKEKRQAMKLRFGKCTCGSGLTKRAVFDGYDIFMTYVCDQCEASKLAEFRRDIFAKYEAEEPIDEQH
jgi:hypothetical protein